MLIHKFFLGDCEGAQFIKQTIFILKKKKSAIKKNKNKIFK